MGRDPADQPTPDLCSTDTRGFAAVDDPNVAVCLLPGTELAFEKEVEWYVMPNSIFRWRNEIRRGDKVARFRKIDEQAKNVHHDALEFPDGQIVLLTELREGQVATVLQLPAEPSTIKAEPAANTAANETAEMTMGTA